ncbi:hypothetical protein CL617_03565 [archaeon]|nr:hypothetical protein [archaeon]|tara:strand:+ start:2065 stop:3090 length:1026 start_codon:yes stop_codon:yes gene_type:complete
MEKEYKIGIIGLGRVANEFDNDPKRKVIWSHTGAYSNNQKCKLTAICDLDQEKLNNCAEKYNVPKTYTDYNEMLQKEDLDILSICTWNSTHYPILKAAVENGVKAIYCEKPIANNLKEADEMIKLCKENNVKLMINHWRRFDGLHPKVKKYIDSGNLGNVQQVNFYYTAGIANSGSHMFDLLRYLFGDVSWIEAHYKTQDEDPNIDGLIKFKNNLLCTIQSLDVDSYTRFNLIIFGTKGKIEITRNGFDLDMYEAKQSDKFSEYKELYKIPSTINFKEESHMEHGIAHLIDCLENNKTPISSGKDGRESLSLICAFHESAKEDGKRIQIPLKESNIEIKSK